jgi:hypothetical protein
MGMQTGLLGYENLPFPDGIIAAVSFIFMAKEGTDGNKLSRNDQRPVEAD